MLTRPVQPDHLQVASLLYGTAKANKAARSTQIRLRGDLKDAPIHQLM